MPSRKLVGPRTSSIQPCGAGRPLSARPKHAWRAALSHPGGSDGSGVKANAHHSSVDASHSRSDERGHPRGPNGYPTFQRNDRIFQFAK